MQAVTIQGPGEIRLEDKPEPELIDGDDAIVRVEATGVCGSDLHIYHGRVAVEPGFTIGHEFVGTVTATGPDVTAVAEGDRVCGCYCTACGECFFCRRGDFHKCDRGRVFGHGKTLGSLQGAQADSVLVPSANLTLRRVPDGMSSDAALFAGDVMGTGFHAVETAGVEPGGTAAVLGLGPVGLCAVQAARAAGAETVVAVDTVEDRLAMAESFGATPVHLTEQDPRAAVKELTEGRGVDVTVDAVGHPDAFDMACRLTRKCGTVSAIGVYTERMEVHMGVVWIKALTVRTGHANVIGHVDTVLEKMAAGELDPAPLVTHHMKLEEAPEAYAVYDRREALKIVLSPVTDPRVLDGLHEQLGSWRAELQGGAGRVGWKIGLNVPAIQEALGIDECVIGHLTTATRLDSGAEFPAAGTTRLVAEPEVAVQIGADGRVDGYAAAIELADVDRAFDDVQAIVAENIFHRGVIIGPVRPTLPDGLAVTLQVNGEERAAAEAPREFDDVVELTGRLLEEAGEALRPGDWLITGSLTPPHPVEAGDEVTVDLGELGRPQVRVS